MEKLLYKQLGRYVDLVVNMLDYINAVCEFKPQSSYYVPPDRYEWERYEPLYSIANWLNFTTTVLL